MSVPKAIFVGSMNGPIHLDREPERRAVEVHDVSRDDMLAPKFEAT